MSNIRKSYQLNNQSNSWFCVPKKQKESNNWFSTGKTSLVSQPWRVIEINLDLLSLFYN